MKRTVALLTALLLASRTSIHAAELEAGTVWVNCYNAFDNAAPWGGFKQSAWGREEGPYGLDLFTQIKSVIINFS
jgi:acyl-CoA reductase-like NAD-dependent aldehyde dehydrogenase